MSNTTKMIKNKNCSFIYLSIRKTHFFTFICVNLAKISDLSTQFFFLYFDIDIEKKERKKKKRYSVVNVCIALCFHHAQFQNKYYHSWIAFIGLLIQTKNQLSPMKHTASVYT